MPRAALHARMPFTSTLRPLPPRFPLDVHPLGRLAGGFLELSQPAFPALGPSWLVLWHPGEEPAFSVARGRIARQGARWRFDGPASEGWVVLWVPEGTRPQGF